jgi:two-component system chemotaxis response regulator CheB
MKGSRKIRVLVVDDSALVRSLIPKALAHEPDIEVVGTAVDPYVARDRIIELEPDILTLDIEMPRMDGLTFLKILMEKHPLPVIILSSLTQPGSHKVMEALECGAVDVLAKPEGSFSLGETGQIMAEKIRAAYVAGCGGRRGAMPKPVLRPAVNTAWHPRQIGLIGASTGGTEAIKVVLEQLPADLPGFLIVQHIPAFISGAFAERLNQVSQLEVREARDGDLLRPGLALLAPGDFHMTVGWELHGYRVHLRKGPKVWYQRPAVDVLFRSAVSCAGAYAVAALLTGMGKDGAEGLLQLRQAGARTCAQDEATSVVYGMPKVAADIGAAEAVLPLDAIAQHMLQALQQRSRETPILKHHEKSAFSRA